MDTALGTLAALAVVIPLLYAYTAAVVQARFPALRNRRVCLLIAHPDDEAMFFAPTVLALTRPEARNHVSILCLSTGNADGLGATRSRELVKSALLLGLRDERDVVVVDNPTDFPDSMTTAWDEDKIASLLSRTFAPQPARRRADDAARPSAGIDVLITFDARGVSSHPNHVSLHRGARAFAAALVRGKPGLARPVDVYSLVSVGIARKYASVADVFASVAAWAVAGFDPGRRAAPDAAAHPPRLLFMNKLTGPAGLGAAWAAMTRAHRSQMVWFRYLWVGFSRYMLINDLQLDKVTAS